MESLTYPSIAFVDIKTQTVFIVILCAGCTVVLLGRPMHDVFVGRNVGFQRFTGHPANMRTDPIMFWVFQFPLVHFLPGFVRQLVRDAKSVAKHFFPDGIAMRDHVECPADRPKCTQIVY